MDNHTRNEEYIKAFGKNLRQLRKSKKLSMEKLAHNAGIEYTQLSRIEHGQIATSISYVHIIARALDLKEKDLFDFEF